MLSLDAAWSLIEQTVTPGPMACVPVSEALGLVLAESIVSGEDSPPFDKSMMDGFAVRAADVAADSLTIVGELTAGQVPRRQVHAGESIRIMTGAPIPTGADAIVPIESTVVSGDQLTIAADLPVAIGDHIVRQGTSMRVGEPLLTPGTCLTPQQVGLLAELGHHEVRVRPRPRVAILTTGNELVPIDQPPGPGQIRNSNEPMLCAQITACGGTPMPLGIARDTPDDLARGIAQGLTADFLCLSGGVSAGKLDLVPQLLREAGVKEVFHKVRLKPGKPVWFGQSTGERPCCIFGLPGNPVSSMVCCELFVGPALARWQDGAAITKPWITARLVAEFTSTSDRPVFFPARLTQAEGAMLVQPVNWQGSFDLRATIDANALACFSAAGTFAAGTLVHVVPLRGTNLFSVTGQK